MRMISERSIFTNGGRTTARGNLPSSTSASFRRLRMSTNGSGVEHPHQRLDTVIEPLGLCEVVSLHGAEQRACNSAITLPEPDSNRLQPSTSEENSQALCVVSTFTRCRASYVTIAHQNKGVVYNLLMKAAAETTLAIASDPKRLGARIGVTAVLHTWGSALTYDCRVGALARRLTLRAVSTPLLAACSGILQAVSRADARQAPAAHKAGKLQFFNQYAHLAERRTFARYLAPLCRRNARHAKSAR
jgi:hypothetical protein